jgi:hypothetical protein
VATPAPRASKWIIATTVENEKAEHTAIRLGADSDQGFAEDLAARVQKGDLVIRDLGYFCLTFCLSGVDWRVFPESG